MKRALVLSGGGAKGAYQIGCIKALKELKINYDIITGTSVGSLNGVLITQHDLKKAIKLWQNMNFNFVFDEDILKKYNNAKTLKDIIAMFGKNFFENGGMDISNLENLVKDLFDEKKFYNSNIDFGFSTFNATSLKGEKYKKNDFKNEKILDYVIASASCYPAFKMKKINKMNYIDGGFFDNLPINHAIEMGADEIIVIDVHGPGIKEKVKKNDIPTTLIEPINDIGNFLNFNKDNANIAMRYGYQDTMKKFNKLEGHEYTFNKNTLQWCHNKYSNTIIETLNTIFDFKENKTTMEELLTFAAYKRLISLRKNNSQDVISETIEYAMNTFNIDKTRIYNHISLNFQLLTKLKRCNSMTKKNINTLSKTEKILTATNKQAITKYFYLQINNSIKKQKIRKDLCKLALIYPKEFLSSLYLYTVYKKGYLW